MRALGACTVHDEATLYQTSTGEYQGEGGTTDEPSFVQKRILPGQVVPVFTVANANAKTSYQSTAQYHTR